LHFALCGFLAYESAKAAAYGCVENKKNLPGCATDRLPGPDAAGAPVFPGIPGFLIISPVCMIAEKAAEVILKAARN
jgi:hypothetical protein